RYGGIRWLAGSAGRAGDVYGSADQGHPDLSDAARHRPRSAGALDGGGPEAALRGIDEGARVVRGDERPRRPDRLRDGGAGAEGEGAAAGCATRRTIREARCDEEEDRRDEGGRGGYRRREDPGAHGPSLFGAAVVGRKA